MVTLLLVMASAAMQVTEADFKCHVSLNNGKEVVAVFRSKEKLTNRVEKEIIGSSVFESDGRTQRKVIQVTQCIEFGGYFSNSRSRELEKDSLF